MNTSLKSMWSDWADQALNHQGTQPMSPDQAGAFLIFTMMELNGVPSTGSLDSALERIMMARMQSLEVKCSTPAMHMLFVLSEGNPGHAVMLCHMAKAITQRTGETLTMGALAEAFPVGFHTPERTSQLWDMQKINGMNMLDAVNAEVLA